MVDCPDCGAALEFIPQYERYYCYKCRKYPPKDLVSNKMGKAVQLALTTMIRCPTCGRNLSYIPKHDRHYCYTCNKYVPKGIEKQRAER